MAAEADRVAGGDGEREVRVDALMTATADAGHVMGFVIEAHAAAEQASGRAADHPSHQLADLVRKGIGLVEPPDGSVGKAIGVAMPDMSGWIGSHIETTHELDAFREIKDDRIAKNVLVDQVIERAVVEHALYSEKPEPGRSFMNGEDFKPMGQIIADSQLHWDFHGWASDEANEVRSVKQGVGTMQDQGWDVYRTWMGLNMR